jgi:hypothetical protein
MRHTFRIAFLPATVLALVACTGTRDDEMVESTTAGDSSVAASSNVAAARDNAQIRVVHAVPGASAVDVYAGEQSAFSNIEFKTVTPYRELGANLPQFKVLTTGAEPTSTPIAENREVVIDGRYYTLIAVPEADGEGVNLMAMRDDPTGGDSTKAHIRVVNAARGLDDLDVRIQGREDALFDDIDFSSEAGFADVDPGTVTLVVTAEDSKKELLRISDLNLEAGKSVTIVLTHPTMKSTKLEAIRVTDAPMR